MVSTAVAHPHHDHGCCQEGAHDHSEEVIPLEPKISE